MKPASMLIEWIRERVQRNEYLYTMHADVERRNDNLSVSEIETVLLSGDIIENYPEDKRGHSCLVVGFLDKKPVHVVCGRNYSGWLVIITVYIPSVPKWRSPLKRSKK